MIRRSYVVVALSSLVALGAACSGDPVGRICDLGTGQPAMSEVVVASPSLDCVSRTCLHVPQSNPNPPAGAIDPNDPANKTPSGLCTAECSSDSDCDKVPESPCVSGFACSVQVTVGPFCCRKFCVCKDFIVVPDDGSEIPIPDACDATNQDNACCNLDGRSGNPAYPACTQ